MGTRIGAALMIVVAVFLYMGIETSGVFGMPDIAVEYTMTTADGSLIPVDHD
jgi:hypothetical protein